jgi:hypothetical protein
MKFTWKGKWRNGEIVVEAETFQELNEALNRLSTIGELRETSVTEEQGIPQIPSMQGCSDAIRALMKTYWGKQPKSMNDIKKALDANALYFSKGILSGTLTTMTKRGELRRVKEEGRWKYLSRSQDFLS